MRLIFQYALFILVATSSIARSESRSTKEDHAVVNLKILLVAFHNGFSRYPENWEEAIAKLDLPEKMIPSMERDISFSSRYRLVNLEGVTIENKIRKIIAMPGDPGKEGLREKALDPEEIIGRKLIAEEETGELRIYRISEKKLDKAFADAGLKLADYSWKPDEAARSNFLERSRDINSGKAPKGSMEYQNSRGPSLGTKTDQSSKALSEVRKPGWWGGGMIVILIVAMLLIAAGWFLKRRKV